MPAVEADVLRVADRPSAPGLFEQRQRARAHHLDAEILQDVQRGFVDRLDLVGRQQRHRRIGIAHPPQRQLRDRRRPPVAGALGAAAASGFVHAGINTQADVRAVRNAPLRGRDFSHGGTCCNITNEKATKRRNIHTRFRRPRRRDALRTAARFLL